jgi:hypothetical protein
MWLNHRLIWFVRGASRRAYRSFWLLMKECHDYIFLIASHLRQLHLNRAFDHLDLKPVHFLGVV